MGSLRVRPAVKSLLELVLLSDDLGLGLGSVLLSEFCTPLFIERHTLFFGQAGEHFE